MPRPKKWRRVYSIPDTTIFGPLDVCKDECDVIIMNVEEIESIRLMDLDDLNQIECAEKMQVARTTFQRIYKDAIRKMADALVNGKVIKIEGGNYALNICSLLCENCGYTWEENFANINEGIKCPKCDNENILSCKNNEGNICKSCSKRRWRGGRG